MRRIKWKRQRRKVIITICYINNLAGGFLGYKIIENKNKNLETANEQNSEDNVLVTGISKKKKKSANISRKR